LLKKSKEIEIMTIQEKLNRKGYNLVASYNNGERVGYFASSRIYDRKTKTYKTQGEVLKSLYRN
jgi:hypothetical protein